MASLAVKHAVEPALQGWQQSTGVWLQAHIGARTNGLYSRFGVTASVVLLKRGV